MKGIIRAVLLIAAAAVLTGCGVIRKKSPNKSVKYIWYLDDEADGLVQDPYEGDLTGTELMDAFLDLIWTVPERTGYRPLLDEDVTILHHTLEGGVLTLDFSSAYRDMSGTREVLARAGIVRTFIQLEEVSAVRFEIEGEEAVSFEGYPLGLMTADSFVEDAGKSINAIQHVAINLYYTGENGNTLKREARSIYYTASKPLEWAIVERIIAGPKVEGNYATVPANTQIISVTSVNGTCYVNLNQTFLTSALNVSEEIPIYSIVNSLIDDCRDVTQVQISIEGESNMTFRQSMDLSHPFEADYTLVEAAQTASE